MELTRADKAQVKRIQEGLRCTEEEALEVLSYDKEVEKASANDRLAYDLDKETEKEAMRMANCRDRKPTVYNFSQRERKANPTKGGIIAELAEFLTKNSQFATEDVEITNKERQIAFKIGEDAFELTLVQKRKPKK